MNLNLPIFIRFLLVTLLLININLASAQHIPNDKPKPPMFSHGSGFYPNDFNLSLSHIDPEATIYFTLDGSNPSPNNLDGKTYKYKNSYQQPSANNKAINIKKNFLYNEYKTYVYDKPILIESRLYQPDRLSQISTTREKTAYYLPTAKKDEKHWVNKSIKKLNMLIVISNYKIMKINRGINSGYRKAYKFFTKREIPLGKYTFIPDIPQITYAVYIEPREYNFKGTPVRAIALDSNGNKSKVVSNTYFIGEKDQFHLPILTITIPEKDLFDYKQGIFVAGKTYDDWIATGNEIISSVKTPFNWIEVNKKKANMVFDFGVENHSVDVDIKPAGLGTRFKPNKSIKVYPNKKYNKQGLDFPVFESNFKSNKNIGFSRIVLRNNAHDGGSMLKDNIFQKVVNGLSFATQNDKEYYTFINGEPNGILTAKYRYDKYYIEDVYNLPNKEIDLIKMLWPVSKVEVLEGDDKAWNDLIQSLKNKNDIENIKSLLDINSFIDYFAAEIFLDNDDWPHNNLRAWRYKNSTNDDSSNPVLDGRWRWMMFDIDSVGARKKDIYLDRNRLRILLNGDSDVDSILIFKALMSNDEIKEQFILRISDLINTTFNPDRVIEFINQAADNVKHDMPKHIQRWQMHSGIDKWQYAIDQMIDFANKRPGIQLQQLQEQFALNDLYQLNVEVNNVDYGTIKLNSLHLGIQDHEIPMPAGASIATTNMQSVLSFPWQGNYFKEMPVSVRAIPRDGYRFSHWEVLGINIEKTLLQNEELMITPNQDTQIKAVFESPK